MILVAGIGNVFLGDDGFGVEVVRRLRDHPFGDAVDVADFGIRGVHLAYELAGGRYSAAILVDVVARGGEPGTLFAIEPEISVNDDENADENAAVDAHTLTPDAVLAWVRRVGALPPRVLLVGCEPASVEASMELSPPVAASVDRAIEMIHDLVAQLSSEEAAPCA